MACVHEEMMVLSYYAVPNTKVLENTENVHYNRTKYKHVFKDKARVCCRFS